MKIYEVLTLDEDLKAWFGKGKKANDPNPNRKGKAKHVNNNPKK